MVKLDVDLLRKEGRTFITARVKFQLYLIIVRPNHNTVINIGGYHREV
jgi:hypothetical protein